MFFELDGWGVLGAGLLEVKWGARKSTCTKMFKLLEAELEVEADLAPLRTRTKGVNAVTETAPPPNPPPRQGRQPNKGKGKGKQGPSLEPREGAGQTRAPSPRSPRGGTDAKMYTPGQPDEWSPCGREGHASKQNYWECPLWKAGKEKRDKATKERQGSAPAPKSGAATEPAASSSAK
jgi:hypothetical protein